MARRELVLPSIEWVFAAHSTEAKSRQCKPEQPPKTPKSRVDASPSRPRGRYEPYRRAYALQTRPKPKRGVYQQRQALIQLPSVASTDDTSSEITMNPSSIYTIGTPRPSLETQCSSFDAFAAATSNGGRDNSASQGPGIWVIIHVHLSSWFKNMRRALCCFPTPENDSPC